MKGPVFWYVALCSLAEGHRRRFWVATSKQTTKQHPLLGNRFLISKFMQLNIKYFNIVSKITVFLDIIHRPVSI
jgi:hypothetical protein